MLAFIENLSFAEIVILIVVAVIVFGGKLPEAAAQAASQIQRLKRQLGDLRRDSGIDRELDDMRRSMDQLPRMPRTIDIVERVAREAQPPPTSTPPPTPAPPLAAAPPSPPPARNGEPEAATPPTPPADSASGR